MKTFGSGPIRSQISQIFRSRTEQFLFVDLRYHSENLDTEFFPNEDEVLELEIIPQKKIRVSRDQPEEEKYSLGNLQLQFGRKLEYLEEELKQKPEIVTNVELCKGQGSPNPSDRFIQDGSCTTVRNLILTVR